MLQMAFAGLLFLGAHLGISSTGLRPRLVGQLGEKGYLGLYSVLALGTLAYLIWLYTELPRFDYLWLPSPTLYLVAKILMPIALIMLVGGFMVPNPTNVGAEGLLRNAEATAAGAQGAQDAGAEGGTDAAGSPAELARGVTRITRHPFQWSVVLWAVCHLLANGDSVSVVFFCTFAILSLAGTVLIDRKKAASLAADWEPYRAQTSNLPFLAIAQGRNRLALRELWLPVAVGIGLYAGIYWGHEWVAGVRIY